MNRGWIDGVVVTVEFVLALTRPRRRSPPRRMSPPRGGRRPTYPFGGPPRGRRSPSPGYRRRSRYMRDVRLYIRIGYSWLDGTSTHACALMCSSRSMGCYFRGGVLALLQLCWLCLFAVCSSDLFSLAWRLGVSKSMCFYALPPGHRPGAREADHVTADTAGGDVRIYRIVDAN